MSASSELSGLLNCASRTEFNESSMANGGRGTRFDNWRIPVLDFAENTPIAQQKLALNFYKISLVQNQPCMVSEVATSQWQSRHKWVTQDGKPDFTYLQEHFGDAMVPVADCQIKHYNSQQKENMTFTRYLKYWKELVADHYNHQKHGTLYLKDWHFSRDFPSYDAYQMLECFSSDWLNEFWSKRTDVCDDYRFVYMGPKGSWTPLHTDVFHSYSWSANICGQKKWILFPPEEEENLKDCTGKLAYDVNLPVDPRQFPNRHKIRHRFEVLQKPGEIVFVPSKWLHQVINLEDTISINHNWFNGFNIGTIWQSLCKALEEVELEIDDCKSMDGWKKQCQLILKATHGMDFLEFHYLLCTIAESRLDRSKQIRAAAEVEEREFCLVNFDLRKLMQIFHNMLNHFKEVDSVQVSFELYRTIKDYLEKLDRDK